MFGPTTTNIIACLIKYEWNMERLHMVQALLSIRQNDT